MRAHQRLESFLQAYAAAHHAIEEAGGQHHVQHRVGGGGGQRIAAKGGAMAAGREVFRHRFAGQYGPHREAAGDALGRRDHIRLDARLLIGEQRAGAPHAALHFIERQQQAPFIAGGTQIAQESGGGDAYAALALYRLDHDAGGLRRDGVAHRVHVAERHMVEAVHRGAEAIEVFCVPGGREHGQRAAMESAVEADHPRAFRPPGGRHCAAHHLDHALIGFRARIAEEHAVGKGRRYQALCQALGLRHAIQVAHMHHPPRLFGDGRNQPGMPVAERGGGDAGAEIEKASVIRGDQPGAFATLESEVFTGIGRHQRGYHDETASPATQNTAA
jgi:hypothetical protein